MFCTPTFSGFLWARQLTRSSYAAGVDSPLEINALNDLDAAGVAFVSVRDNLVPQHPFGEADVSGRGRHGRVERALTQERWRADCGSPG
jgi:hypothetical protein